MTAARLSRRLLVTLAVLALAIVAGVFFRGAGGPGSDPAAAEPAVTPLSSPQPDPTASPTPIPSASTDPELLDELESSVTTVLDEAAVISADPVDVDSLHVGNAFLSELEAERLEFTAEGWTREGQVTVDDVEMVSAEPADAPTSALITACVDASDIVVRRADGEVVPGDSPPPATNYFALEREADEWIVVGRSFPNDPRCDDE